MSVGGSSSSEAGAGLSGIVAVAGVRFFFSSVFRVFVVVGLRFGG